MAQKFGHVDVKQVVLMSERKIVAGMDEVLPESEKQTCEVCFMAK